VMRWETSGSCGDCVVRCVRVWVVARCCELRAKVRTFEMVDDVARALVRELGAHVGTCGFGRAEWVEEWNEQRGLRLRGRCLATWFLSRLRDS
jgi:hypothetical protein